MNKFTKIFVGALAAVAIFASAASAAYTHTGLLKMGMTSSQVMSLQQALNANGFVVATTGAGSPGMESMYFGAKTKAAVMAFQSAKGLSPVDGIVGNITGTSLMANAGGGSGVYPAGCTSNSGFSTTTGMPCSSASLPTGCTSTAGFSPVTGMSCSGGSTPTSGPLAGTDGTIANINTLSSYSGEEVGEGANDVKVAGFEVEASNDGDVAIKSMKVTFDPTGNDSGDSDHMDDYVDSVSIWMGSTKVGSADADDFSENSNDTASKVVTLSGATVKSDQTEKFYITVDAVSNLDSGDIDGTVDYSVGLENVRYEDGSGVVTTLDASDSTFDDGDGEIGWGVVGDGVSINFVDFGTAADTELKVTTSSDTPEAGIVMVDDSDQTDGVTLLKGKLTLDGDSDVTIDSFPVTLTATGATDIDNITGSLTLIIGGEEFTETVSTATETSATITFDNLDFDMSAGDSISFEVKADVEALDGVEFDEGDTLVASITASQVDNTLDVENEEGDQLSTSETTGSATGDAQEFRTNGIEVTLVDLDAVKSASDTNDADTATFTIKFKVKAIGETVYVSTLASTGGAINNTYTVSKGSTSTTAGVSEAIQNNTDTDLSTGNNWTIIDGESETIELTVLKSITAGGNDGLYKAALASVKWNTDDSTTFNSYTSNLDSFVTGYISLD